MKQTYDIIVVGGGPGGIGAAVGAAKHGAKVLLAERYGFLGGMATTALVSPFMPFTKGKKQQATEILDEMLERLIRDGALSEEVRTFNESKKKEALDKAMLQHGVASLFASDEGGNRLTSDVFNEILERLKKEGALAENERTFDDEVMKIILDRMLLDYGIDILFHSYFVGLELNRNSIETVYFENKSGKTGYKAKIFIDSTGDGDVAVMAGAEFEIGRPGDSLCMAMSLCFRIGGIKGFPEVPNLNKELSKILQAAKKAGEVDQPRDLIYTYYTLQPDIYHFNCTRILRKNGTNAKDLTEAEIEGRRQAYELFKLFKKRSWHFKDSYLIKTACQVGVRETRRVMGKYVLTEEDVLSARKFDDGIARCCYPIDIHNPTGPGTLIDRIRGDYYEIPYRCLVPRGLDNLLIGSRCVSADHKAHGSLRLIPVVSGIGEACGIAAAWAVLYGITPGEVDGKMLKREILG